jgi:hypothetical protein
MLIQGFDDQKFENNFSWEKNLHLFGQKIAICLSLGLHKGRPSYRTFSTQKRKSSTSKHEISSLFFYFSGVIFALLDLDPADRNQ